MRRALAAIAAAFALVAGVPAGAHAADDASIAHVEATDDGLRILVSLPADSEANLDKVSASLDGERLDATAELAGTDTVVERTSILVIDTSNSMSKHGRFEAAQAAATAYVEAVPDDVRVGIVTFDDDVTTALEPTTDRGEAIDVINALQLSKQTLLYDGVLGGVAAAGETGQRSLLVLSDGADTGRTTSLDDVAAAVTAADVQVNVVALDQRGKALRALEEIAGAGSGEVIAATGADLAQHFADEAEVLARQVLVTAPLPAEFSASEATVEVKLPTPTGTLVASALAPIHEASGDAAPADLPELASPSDGWETPGWLLYAGIAVFGVGLLTAALLLVPGKPQPLSIAERVSAYTQATQGGGQPAPAKAAADPVIDQAKAAAAGLLERNRNLNDRLTTRLSAAGSELKPSEWLLFHVIVTFIGALVGFVLGGGSVIVGALLMLVAATIPPVYLRWKASRRRRAFNDALPEVLQLLSGALSAGLSLAQACDTVVNEGPEPIASEFKRVLVEARIGVTLEDAFEGVAERYDSQDFAWAVMAIRIQRQVGGNLAELLTTVANTMRERQALRRHVHALSAEGRLSAYLLCGLPISLFFYLLLTNRDYLEPLLTDPRGWAVDAAAVAMMSLGGFVMFRMVKVEL